MEAQKIAPHRQEKGPSKRLALSACLYKQVSPIYNGAMRQLEGGRYILSGGL